MANIVVCDYCGEIISEPFADYRGDLDSDCLAVIEVKPRSLNSTKGNISNPDLCRACIIKTLQN